ncbi:MAG: nuclear transport factor 2 family protein [Niabella sp.]
MKSLLFFILLLSSLAGCAQKNKTDMEQNKQREEQAVLAITQNLTQYMIERDTAAINKIVDANFTLTHITGYVQYKAEWLKEIASESMKYYSAKEVSKRIKIDGNKAEFKGQNILDARIWGTRDNWRLQQIMQLEKRNGEWIILNSVASIF